VKSIKPGSVVVTVTFKELSDAQWVRTDGKDSVIKYVTDDYTKKYDAKNPNAKDDSSSSTVIIVIAVVIVVLIIAAVAVFVVVRSNNGDGGATNADGSRVVSFENPMYDQNTGGKRTGEPTYAEPSELMNTGGYMDVGGGAPSGGSNGASGYMDVNPSDGAGEGYMDVAGDDEEEV
jgi:hypothetical protein